jgi:hypothetical protein
MRILTLPVPEHLLFSPVVTRFSSVKKLHTYIFLFILIFATNDLKAQWVNNPAENTRAVFDLADPINITATGDQNGGAFIFWEDNLTGLQNEVRFMHIDSNGRLSFQSSGKRISEKTGDQDNPISVSAGKNSAVVAWKDFSINRTGDLLIQKVKANGTIFWNPEGVKINIFNKEISDYSLCTNKKGEIFITYLTKEPGNVLNSKLMLQKMSSTGEFLFDTSGIDVSSSQKGKLIPSVNADDSDGVYLFWIESSGDKGIIFSQHYDKTGKSLWGKKPLAVTDNNLNVITFSAMKSGADVYIAYQVLRKNKSIYHQLIDPAGKKLWGKNGKVCSVNKGIMSNPQMISSSKDIILSWTYEENNNRDIYIQKYNRNGDPLWNSGGLPVIKMNGDQFGQKLISDDHNGAIIAWLDRRTPSVPGNVYSQRIDSYGNIMWDSSGIAIGSFFNTTKSYLNLLPDGSGSAIGLFKEKRNSENGIYVQKIYNTGTFISQIIGFSTSLNSDSVKITWYSANETAQSEYSIERCIQTDSGNTDWQKLITLNSLSGREASFYEYYDSPDTSGTIYYRVIHRDNSGNMQFSDISRVTFFESTNYIIVTQNNPNPFSDSTVIKFYLPEELNVKIEFFDNHIEKIDEIKNKFPAGENSITFAPFNRQPGIYFYKFECGDFVEVKKMVLTN